MHRIDTPTAQPDKFGPGKNGFTGGNPQTGQLPTALDQDFFDALQEEIARVVEGAGLELDKQDHGQMLIALGMLFAEKDATITALSGLATSANKLAYFTGNDKAALTDLTATGRGIIGQNDITGVLSFLGLGEGSSLPIGIPVPYSLSTAPAGWLKCNGASFSASQYPKLALAYPSLKLPDLRGEFIRGWDDGREVDSGRALISNQGDAMRNIQARIDGLYRNNASGTPTGAFTMASQSTGVIAAGTALTTERIALFFDASNAGVPLATEIRPRNVAFNYIVRAA